MNQHKLPYLDHLFSALLAFYVSSCVAMSFLIPTPEAKNITEMITLSLGILGYIMAYDSIPCLFFFPILLLVSKLNWKMTHKVKYFISFISIILYGYLPYQLLLMIQSSDFQPSDSEFYLSWAFITDLVTIKKDYFPTAIPTAILFLILLIWINSLFSRRHQRKLTQE